MGIDGLMVSLVKYGQKGPLFRKIKKRSNFSNFFMILLCSMAKIRHNFHRKISFPHQFFLILTKNSGGLKIK